MADEVRRVADEGLPRGHVLREPARSSAGRASTPTTGTRSGRRARTRARSSACTSARRRSSSITADDAPIDVMITLHADEHRAGRGRPRLVAGAAQVPRPASSRCREGGIGWIPYFLERVDYVYQHHQRVDAPGLRRPAAEPGVPRAHHHAASSTTRPASSSRDHDRHRHDHVGVRLPALRLDVAARRPRSVDEVSSTACPTTTIDKITHENAMRLFQFDPFAHRPKEQCTVGALRAEAPDVDVVTRSPRQKRSNTDISSFVNTASKVLQRTDRPARALWSVSQRRDRRRTDTLGTAGAARAGIA